VIGFNRGGIPTEISVANQGSFSARWTGRHLLEEIGLRVVRYLWEKCDLKAAALAEMRECGLLGQDPVRPGHVGQSSALYSRRGIKRVLFQYS
jgi:hypothetical protein